eukprot:14486221-Alexandrium_andersonii.AAC.1
MEGGDPATAWDAYVKSAARDARWIDGLCIVAACSRMARNITIARKQGSAREYSFCTALHPIFESDRKKADLSLIHI